MTDPRFKFKYCSKQKYDSFGKIITNVREYHRKFSNNNTKQPQHYSLFFRGDIDDSKKLLMSTNYVVNDAALPSIHSEHSGIIKLMRLNRFRRFFKHEKIDILVIRISASGVIGYSRPCRDCLARMMNCSININNVYYTTDANGSINSEKLPVMYDSPLTKFSSGRMTRIRNQINKKKKKA